MKRKIAIIFSLLLCTVILSGCWSKKELTDLAIVIAVGIDKTKDGKFVMTFQVVNPGNVAGATQRGGGSGGVPVSIYKATGNNLIEASRKASKKLSRLIYYAHTNLVVIGEEVAKEGINGLFDALERSGQFRTTAMVVVAHHHSAEDVLKILTPIDKIPANQIIKTVRFSEKTWGQTMNVSVGDVINDLASSGKTPTISGVEIVGGVKKGKRQANVQASEPDARLNVNGIAMFKNDKLAGWIFGETSRGVLWVMDKIEQTDITVEWKRRKEAVAYEVVRAKTSVAAHMKRGKPSISIRIKAEGDIGEALVPVDFTDPMQILALEKKIEQTIKNEVIQAVEKAQEEKTDIFGFGNVVYRSYPREWKKMKHDWDESTFPHLEVNVTVDAFIRRTGLRTKPYILG
ncbi:Ger(x)C family spore germination protein [Parageobacillus thermoglucosidasius]|uniref:Germination protein, Ger(X)C family n=1 Tax=Geobacillus sp. (strain Y4.1MC1) TaxID=581103 RepID=A0A7U4DKW2_GEOS0|nr:Ger(x)C family spore germination protein [Parageobacillus thermoglucosidasius]MBY6267304.1 Ger(x)C family spore germination protein [Parageobacillus thermoglucosidasius]MED4903475.1 Ger(x)C family spore germination protein [Parageobacillus thermoglucosidasius]MED4912816.1 Ger(x)C family spore germination protein [Parageobacillus thermoglucosidasius]MED4945206.1 Ger(x)C family spore germination protein [Parageobacillus thermoglucosidasius]MED4982315.1 Ger(x)C family spore germination protein